MILVHFFVDVHSDEVILTRALTDRNNIKDSRYQAPKANKEQTLPAYDNYIFKFEVVSKVRRQNENSEKLGHLLCSL